MTEYLYWIFGFAILAVFAVAAREVIKLMSRWLEVEENISTADTLDSIIYTAVYAIEEEARVAAPGNKPSSAQKRELAVGFVTRMLTELKITAPLDIIIGKIDSAVHRLFNTGRK